jgi:flagellar biosynthetic protein FliR
VTPDDFHSFLTTGVFAFMLTFVRVGTAIMVMPGIGNAFVPQNIRLYFALAFAFVVFPIIQSKIPYPLPATFNLFTMIIMEFIAGLFLGTIMRVLLAAVDTAGMIISTQSSLANAQLFNPAFASQGTVIGSFLTLAATVTDLHHLMLTGIIESYNLFPINKLPPVGDMADVLVKEVGLSFVVAIQMGAPFLVLVTILYVGMAVMSKLMPQVQVFMLAVPIQVTLALITLSMAMSTMMLFWLDKFDEGYQFFYSLLVK